MSIKKSEFPSSTETPQQKTEPLPAQKSETISPQKIEILKTELEQSQTVPEVQQVLQEIAKGQNTTAEASKRKQGDGVFRKLKKRLNLGKTENSSDQHTIIQAQRNPEIKTFTFDGETVTAPVYQKGFTRMFHDRKKYQETVNAVEAESKMLSHYGEPDAVATEKARTIIEKNVNPKTGEVRYANMLNNCSFLLRSDPLKIRDYCHDVTIQRMSEGKEGDIEENQQKELHEYKGFVVVSSKNNPDGMKQYGLVDLSWTNNSWQLKTWVAPGRIETISLPLETDFYLAIPDPNSSYALQESTIDLPENKTIDDHLYEVSYRSDFPSQWKQFPDYIEQVGNRLRKKVSIKPESDNTAPFDREAELQEYAKINDTERKERFRQEFFEKQERHEQNYFQMFSAIDTHLTQNPDFTPESITQSVLNEKGMESLSPDQKELLEEVAKEICRRHLIIKELKKNYPDKNDLYRALNDNDPPTEFTATTTPYTIEFRSDSDTVNKLCASKGKVRGFATTSSTLEMLGTSIIVYSEPDKSDVYASYNTFEILKHERMHVLFDILNGQKRLQEFNAIKNRVDEIWKNEFFMSQEERNLAIEQYYRNLEQFFLENHAKNEIIAYMRQPSGTKERVSMRLNQPENAKDNPIHPVYDYISHYRNDLLVPLIAKTQTGMKVDPSLDKLQKQYLVEDYNKKLSRSLDHIEHLIRSGYTREEASLILLNHPLSQWSKVVYRLTKEPAPYKTAKTETPQTLPQKQKVPVFQPEAGAAD